MTYHTMSGLAITEIHSAPGVEGDGQKLNGSLTSSMVFLTSSMVHSQAQWLFLQAQWFTHKLNGSLTSSVVHSQQLVVDTGWHSETYIKLKQTRLKTTAV